MWRWLRYFGGKASASIQATPVVQLISVTTIAVSLMVFGVVVTVVLNVDRLADRWGQQVRVVAFLAGDAGPDALAAAETEVAGWAEVTAVTTRTREQAMAEFKAALGRDKALLDGLDASLVPASIEVELAEAQRTPAKMGALAARLRQLPNIGEVDHVDYGQDLVARLHGLRDLLRLSGLVIGVLVALAMVFIISNTVRLGLYARRDELEIMQLVGATDRFIRAPFYLEGAFQGTLGAGMGILLLWAVYRLVLPAGERVLQFDLLQVRLDFLPASTLALMVVGAAVVGVLASHLSTTRFLRGRGDML
jgi:cell division transport system permease protein